ncbi:hypothetical protein DF185_07190 [Marinifilum breve]|uniref:HNH nuclease domain-containing protein n=1 Tax=Marinifilum breve TaxID=2184082 RepID=A0A2V4A1D9_9BACT|nr:hypothetical protein [Marinifilum breve]PXY02426.1 hypothetical protein DF185_07190 [Marinifilum breve]
MKIDVEFNTLDALRKVMGAKLLKLTDVQIEQTAFEILKSDDGAEVDFFEDVDVNDDGTILHKETGKPVLLYIREPFSHTPKYHIAGCSTLRSYVDNGRIERYVAAYRDKDNPSTRFKLNLLQDDYSRKTYWKELDVCKNCLRELNYKGYNYYKSKREEIFNNFNIADFFESYDTTRHGVNPKREENDFNQDEYPPNWKFISNRYKRNINFHCEKCKINLSDNTKYLHLHHKNGYKKDCSDENLIGLCIKCHSEEPQHHHLKNTSDYNSFILLYTR